MAKVTVAEFLRALRAKIATPQQWCKGDFKTPDGRHCIVGAGLEVLRYDKLTLPEGYTISKTLGFGGLEKAAHWNDEPKRTHAEVLARIDEYIARNEK